MLDGEAEPATTDHVYTPQWIFDALGLRFDLDVAAPRGGVPWIPADRFYTKDDDGLAQPWDGRVWMNPPYSRPKLWVARFLEHANGVAMLPVNKAAWMDDIWDEADAIVKMPYDFAYVREGASHGIFLPTIVVAIGPENAAALHNLGTVR